MAGNQDKPGARYTRKAKRDLSDYQYHAMQQDSGDLIDYVDSSSTGILLGVLYNKPDAANEEAEIVVTGTALLYVDGNSVNIVGGATFLGSNSNYHGVAVSTDKDQYFALALEDSTADGDLIEVLLLGGPHYLAA